MTADLRAVIFDFNGVIIDDEHLHYLAFAATLQERGHALTESDYLTRYLGLDDKTCLGRAVADRGDPLDAAAVWALVERKAHHYEAELEREMKLIEGAVDFVRDCAKHVPCAIASGARRREIEVVTARAGIRDCFRAIVSADEVQRGKPAPDGYLQALDALRAALPDLKAAQCLVLEDAPNGIRAARAAGMRVIALTSSVDAAALAEADRSLPHLRGASFATVCALLP
jgi:HAD superfamily hydrolase (TIGR01509 family)